MPTYTINWAAFNEVLEQLTTVQNEISTLNQEFASGNTSALSEWQSSVKELFDAHKTEWNTATAEMERLAKDAQIAAAQCREEYAGAVKYGTQLWGR
ncbi:hypothetical protein ACFWBB_10530 [Streptomyces sp. NPDC060000]|uniref:hypothetical protein n=1 Tax=Streptomyces sp. NPDC060000 TaxID=3347031 RepID=UPI00367473F1